MTTVNVNQMALGIESFGDDDAPLVLLAGGSTMLSWPDALCERLTAAGRHVVRYDLRGSGKLGGQRGRGAPAGVANTPRRRSSSRRHIDPGADSFCCSANRLV
jgi:pimeloyl-ACP methyl ester carboxylesterase